MRDLAALVHGQSKNEAGEEIIWPKVAGIPAIQNPKGFHYLSKYVFGMTVTVLVRYRAPEQGP